MADPREVASPPGEPARTGWTAHHEWGAEGTSWSDPDERRREGRGLRHRTDWLALLGGLLFIGIGVRFIAGPSPDPLTMLVVLLAGLAAAGLVALVVGAARGRR